jgi:hypothetical protein
VTPITIIAAIQMLRTAHLFRERACRWREWRIVPRVSELAGCASTSAKGGSNTAFAALFHNTMMVMNPDGGNRHVIFEQTHNVPAWSPRRDLILFTSDRDGDWEL